MQIMTTAYTAILLKPGWRYNNNAVSSLCHYIIMSSSFEDIPLIFCFSFEKLRLQFIIYITNEFSLSDNTAFDSNATPAAGREGLLLIMVMTPRKLVCWVLLHTLLDLVLVVVDVNCPRYYYCLPNHYLLPWPRPTTIELGKNELFFC